MNQALAKICRSSY